MGRKRNWIMLHAKIMPNVLRFASTRHRISKEYCGSKMHKLARTGWGNKFSSNMCRDVSCLIIKDLESKDFGIKIKSNMLNEQKLRTAVAFVYDVNLIEDSL